MKKIINANINGLKKNPQNINRKGRPKNSFSLLNDSLKAQGYEPLTKGALHEAYSLILSLDESKIIEIREDENQPFAVRLIIQELTDKNSRGKTLQDMRNYLFGTATERIEHTSQPVFGRILTDLTDEQIQLLESL